MIKYIPSLDTLLWSFKSIEYFDTHEDLKAFIALQRTLFCRFVGKVDKCFHPSDVVLSDPLPQNPFIFWENYRSVHVDGIIVGHCGE